jgi:hypothetical protein
VRTGPAGIDRVALDGHLHPAVATGRAGLALASLRRRATTQIRYTDWVISLAVARISSRIGLGSGIPP